MPCSNDDFADLVDQLPEVTLVEGSSYTALKVRGKGFGYHWLLTSTAGLKQERRALRVRVQELAWEWQDDALLLRFRLGPGAYATELLADLGEVT